jgi:Legume lectin domain
MRNVIRCASLALVSVVLVCLCVSVSAQIRFEDFSNTSYAQQYLRFNNSIPYGGAGLATWDGLAVLRLTDGGPNLEAATVYFRDAVRAAGGKQPVAGGFTTWFEFQVHSPSSGASVPGDGFAFIIQNSTATDTTMGASGLGIAALGAGGNPNYPPQTGALGYAGINNNLVIEFDIAQDLWDPNGNHISIQTCGPNTNTPVHESGDYTIGNNDMVTSCLLSQGAIDTSIENIGDICSGGTCMDGIPHNVVIGYTPPQMGQQQGLLQIWLDPTFVMNTHIPIGMPTMSVPYNIVYDSETNPNGLQLDPINGGSAWVGYTASQPATQDPRLPGGEEGANGGTAQDIFGWEFTLSSPVMITQTIQPGGQPTQFMFGAHQTDVTYPSGFQNPNGIQMTVTATPIDRQLFYMTRLAGTDFSNEQCVVYGGTGGGSPPTSTNGNCIVYSYMCQQNGEMVDCPSEMDPTIVVDTSFYTMDPLNNNNTDYLENDMIGDNNWVSIFTMYQPDPLDGTTSGGTKGFGGSGTEPSLVKRRVVAGQVTNADIVATFCPNGPGGGGPPQSGCSSSLSRSAGSAPNGKASK